MKNFTRKKGDIKVQSIVNMILENNLTEEYNSILLNYGYIIFLVLSLSFTLLCTFFSRINLINSKFLCKKSKNDIIPNILYFISFFILIFLLPLIVFFISLELNKVEFNPVLVLNAFGLTSGKWKLGSVLALIGIIVAPIISKSSIEKTGKFYPFSKSSLKNFKSFFIFELSYFLFYYFAWEFIFRGYMLKYLLVCSGYSIQGIIIAISIQTIISTIYHIGHPFEEILGAFAGGFIFGIIALFTGSFLYTWLIHAALGIATDTFVYLAQKKITN